MGNGSCKVLPFVLPQERSGTKKEQVVGMRDGSNLVATCHIDLPTHRQVPAAHPTGTCMPSASICSMMATAAKATPQPVNTNQPQSETQVYPFSQCQQVVTDSTTPDDQEPATSLPTGNCPSWADKSTNDQDVDPDSTKPVVDKVADSSQRSAMYLHLHRPIRFLIERGQLLSSGRKESWLLSQNWLLRLPTLVLVIRQVPQLNSYKSPGMISCPLSKPSTQ